MNKKKLIITTATLIITSIILFFFVFYFNSITEYLHSLTPYQSLLEKSTSTHDATTKESEKLTSIAFSILSLTTLASIITSFYLYRWRRILLANPNTVVPEEWAKYLHAVGVNIEKLSNSVQSNISQTSQDSKVNIQKIDNMISTFMELQDALDSKDREISRLKNGYDAEIFRKFIARFARVDQAIEDAIIGNPTSDDLLLIKRLMEDAFEECGVNKTSPNIGDDYRTVRGVSDNPKVVLTNDPSLEFKITEIIEYGYETTSGVERKSIIPSKVKIFKYAEEAK